GGRSGWFDNFCFLHGVISVQPVARAQIEADVRSPLIDVDWRAGRTDEPWRSRRVDKVRTRNQLDQSPDHRICDRGPLSVAQDHAVEVLSLALAQTLISKEKEQLFLNDRAAQVSPKLVALEWRGLVRGEFEEVAGVERVVAKEFERFTVKLISAGARGQVHDCAGTLSVLRTKS